MTVTLVGFDADDTLWHSESHFVVTEERFQALVRPWSEPGDTAAHLLDRERQNLEVFGYGVKGFTLSMIETALELSDNTIPQAAISQIILWGKEMMRHPVDLLPGARQVVLEVSAQYQTVLITKGDLFHQESKVAESGLADHFDRVEILTEKTPDQYRNVLGRCGGVRPDNFVMVGNSMRSDVLPVVEMGGRGIHVPHEHLWGHEEVAEPQQSEGWWTIEKLADLPDMLAGFDSAPHT